MVSWGMPLSRTIFSRQSIGLVLRNFELPFNMTNASRAARGTYKFPTVALLRNNLSKIRLETIPLVRLFFFLTYFNSLNWSLPIFHSLACLLFLVLHFLNIARWTSSDGESLNGASAVTLLHRLRFSFLPVQMTS